MDDVNVHDVNVVIIGGGIAGTTCAEYIGNHDSGNKINVIIITPKDVVKTAVTQNRLTRTLTKIGVEEKTKALYQNSNLNVEILVGSVKEVDADAHLVILESGKEVKYTKLCVCTGAKPVPFVTKRNPHILCIRDTDTVNDLKKRLSSAKKVIIIGNGGIALELVYEIVGCEVIWCIKDNHIGNNFFDEGAAAFMIDSLEGKQECNATNSEETIFKRKRFEAEKTKLSDKKTRSHGVALGPDWSGSQELTGCNKNFKGRKITVKYSSKIEDIWCGGKDPSMPENVYVKLSNGEIIGGDLIVSATGVLPNLSFPIKSKKSLELSDDGGINVNEQMQSNIPDIYAAGDVCTPTWEYCETWFPMKLWTQAWQMAAYAGKCISSSVKNEDPSPFDMCFELFSHTTTFFGYKVCLLGCYNGQNMKENGYEILLRYTRGVEYIKVVISDGRLKGCLLIGETDLEGTFENLILDALDVTFLGDALLDPNIDIEDYFD